MISILDHHQLYEPFRLTRQTLRVRDWNNAVEPSVHDKQRAGNILRNALERQCKRVLARFFLRAAVASDAESFAGQFRQAVPSCAPVERPAKRDTGFDAFVEGRGARRIVAAQADAPHAKALRV